MINTKFKLTLLLLSTISLLTNCSHTPPCNTEQTLGPTAVFENYKKGNFYCKDCPWTDINGNEISKDSMLQLDKAKYSSDVIIDCNGKGIRRAIRLRTLEDDSIAKALNNYNYFNVDNYIKFIEYYENDPLVKEKIINHAKNSSHIEAIPINCDTIAETLSLCYEKDQAVRSKHESYENILIVDRSNQEQLVSIITHCGYQTIEAAGEEAVYHAWSITQHAPIQIRSTYIDYFEQSCRKGLLDFKNIATMIDRNLIDQGHQQIYGSQFKFVPQQNKYIMEAVEDMDRMVFLRDSLGMLPIEEYAKKVNHTN